MTMAISKALETGSRAVICASTGNTSASAAAFAARAGIRAFVMVPQGLGRARQALAGRHPRGQGPHGRRQLRPGADDRPPDRRAPPGHARELGEPVPARGAEDRRLRGRGSARARARLPPHPRRQRRQHHRLLAGLPRVPPRRDRGRSCREMVGFQAAGAAPIYENRVIEEPRTVATAIKIGNPASWGPRLEAVKDSRGLDRHRDRRGDPPRLPARSPARRASSWSRPRRRPWPA